MPPRRPRNPLQRAPTTGTHTGEADKTAAQSELTRAQAALDEARARDAAKSPAAFAAVEAWKRAVAASEAAGNLVEEADRRGEQVSVFISTKEGRIFIRQDWKDVWEAPVTIRDPDRPLGTHVYTAVERRARRLVHALDGDLHAARGSAGRRSTPQPREGQAGRA